MRKNKGFTLIELLVVIAIISVIAAMVGIMAGRMQVKAQITQTRGTIMALTTACEEYHRIFFAYPAINDTATLNALQTHPTGGNNYPGADKTSFSTLSAANQIEWNKRLNFMLTSVVYSAEGGEKFVDPPVQTDLPSTTVDPTTNANLDSPVILDAFGEILLVNPSRDHSGDTPAGPNHRRIVNGNNDETFFVPDIYSKGPDFTDNTGGDFNSTSFNATVDDDITNWFAQSSE